VSENFGVEEEVENPLHQERCRNCDVSVGQLHELGCTVESCPYCGGQLITCGHMRSLKRRPPDDDRLPWEGLCTGAAECIQWGWYARRATVGWVPCNQDEPDAIPDLNRLRKDARWDRPSKKWVRLTDKQSKSGRTRRR
jgi:hypothetical protein